MIEPSDQNPSAQSETRPEIRGLLVTQDHAFAEELGRNLAQDALADFILETHSTFAQGLERAQQPGIDVFLLDLGASGTKGMGAIGEVQAAAPLTPLVIVSDLDDVSLGLEVVRQGAQDFLVKSQLTPPEWVRGIRLAIARKQSDLASRQAEERYHSLFDHIVEGIFRTSPDGRYLDANPALARIYGYDSPEELIHQVQNIGRSVYVNPSRRQEFIRLMEQNDVLTGFESPVYRKDGSIIWISENVQAVRHASGELICYEGTVEDISHRKLTEESLKNSESLYHSLVENVPQNIFRKDLEERFTFANQRFCQTLNRSLEEILGKTDFDFFPPELAAKYQADDQRIIETGQLFNAIEEHRLPSGGVIYVQVVKTPLYDAHGQIIGLQGIFWDITEEKLAQERLQQANAELAKSQGALRQKNEQMEEDLRMAREIQQAILPQQYPTFPKGVPPDQSALCFCHSYSPSGVVGGDFFNVAWLSDTLAGVFICDVMGHGVRSALITAMVRALVEELSPKAAGPGQLLTALNHDLRMILRQTRTPMFTTAFCLVADLVTGEMRYANAGHPPQMIARRSTREVIALTNNDGLPRPPLGLFGETVYPSSSISLVPGDLVVLFTDGLFEVEGSDQRSYSHAMLKEAIQRRLPLPPQSLFDDLLEEIRNFSATGGFSDDVCVVGMEVVRLYA
jgi:sigma-B regulation protein RsbU (phosphoserine phosphatase)